MSSREPYRFISYDSRDEHLVQFYFRTVSANVYLNFTYISPRDKRWIDIIEVNDVIFFTQDNVDVASAVITAPWNSENGFRLDAMPAPALNEGRYYGIDFSRDRPEEDRDVPIENRGFSPLFGIQYLTFDGTTYSLSNMPTATFCFRLVDWTGGRGTKPSNGFLGVNGTVADVNNAAIMTLPTGPRGEGAKWTTETTLPTNNRVVGDMNLFPTAVASGLANYFEADGTTPKADAAAGEVARWDGTKWRFVMVLSVQGLAGSGLFVDMHDGLRAATEDDYGKVGIGPDGILYRVKRTANPGHDAAGTFNAYTHAQYRGVAHNRPSNPQNGEIYYNVRIHQWYLFFRNQVVATIDARPITPTQALGANAVWLGEVDDVYQARHAIQNFDNTKAYYAVYGEVLYVLDNTTYTAATTQTTYTYQWVESIPDNIVTHDELTNTLEAYGFSFIEVLPRKARIDELYKSWIISLGQVYSPYDTANRVEVFLDFTKVYDSAYNPATDRFIKFDISNANAGTIQGNTQDTDTHWPVELRFFNSTTRVGTSKFTSVVISREDEPNPFDDDIIKSLEAKTADIELATAEAWAAATDASFLALPSDNAQLVRVRAGNVPIGLSGWATDITTTEPRVILVRVPVAAKLADYRLLIGDRAVRLNTFGVDATGTSYAYMTPTSLTLQKPTRIRLQYHGSDTHTRFIGLLAEAIMARLLPDPSGAEAGQVPQVNTDVDGYVLGALAGGGLSMQQLTAILMDYVTETQFRDYRPHTPDRGDTLPVHLLPQGTFVLQKTSHWSDKFYRFYPIGRDITLAGRAYSDFGTIEISLSSEWTVFESTTNANPPIFSSTRIAGIVVRQAHLVEGDPMMLGYTWQPKIIMDKELFGDAVGGYDYGGLSIRMRNSYQTTVQGSHFDGRLYLSSFDRDGDDQNGTTEIVAGGKTYVCFVPDNRNFNWTALIQNSGSNNGDSEQAGETLEPLSFQILKSRTNSPVFPPTDPQFLSDDPSTPWVDGDEFVTGLYEGDANGHPVPRILPPLDIWNHVVARSNTYFSGTGPDAAAGVDGQFWANLRNGQIHQKQSGTWTLITDLALQTEISRATEWSTIPNNRQIPADFIARVSGRYFGAKLQHVKTSGSSAPTSDATNWIELSNEASAGSSAVAVEWSSIPQNTGVALGTIVKHGNYTYMCITAHNRISTGPDADSTNWQLLTNYQGTWAAGYYHSGAIVNVGSLVFIALQDVTNRDPSPTATTNTKWLQINNTDPTVRYAELTINSGLAINAANTTYTTLTFAAAAAQAVNATGVIARATAGNAITLTPGSYRVDTHIVMAASGASNRFNYDVQLYDGTNQLDIKPHVGYVRTERTLGQESISSHHTITISADTTLQVRVKKSNTGNTAPPNTGTGGSVTVRKL